MCDADFESYRMKIFNTNINVLEKAINKAKHGLKANKMESKHLQDVVKNIQEIQGNTSTLHD